MTHESRYRLSAAVPDRPSGSRSGEVRVSYFDPVTGEPCESKPKPRAKQIVEKESSAERDRRYRKAQAEAAEIMRGMKDRKRRDMAAHGRTGDAKCRNRKAGRPVLVDGVRFGSIHDAAMEMGTYDMALVRAIKGSGVCKGRRVAFAEGD